MYCFEQTNEIKKTILLHDHRRHQEESMKYEIDLQAIEIKTFSQNIDHIILYYCHLTDNILIHQITLCESTEITNEVQTGKQNCIQVIL
jgi:hypothetical protein